MHIILGATGHVGSAVARALLQQGQPVTVVTRDAAKSADWQQRGAQVAVADVRDAAALRRVLQQGRRLFLLNPPAPPDSDSAAEERRTLRSILQAIEGSGLERIVAESTTGPSPGAASATWACFMKWSRPWPSSPFRTASSAGPTT
ncbi:NAD(P)H-binding protein [Hymenobacter gummosus]|uniref:NAD(P)H-binding protein n=1 Tax=Hymenobacter gummosus TaxID=1776032 RepID=UPI001A9D5F0C|nr:NAD(P)H-binding protein [Hymenobacter gummosus]